MIKTLRHYLSNIRQAKAGYVLIAPTFQKDGRTYAKIGEKEDGTELYKRLTFDENNMKVKQEIIEIKEVPQ